MSPVEVAVCHRGSLIWSRLPSRSFTWGILPFFGSLVLRLPVYPLGRTAPALLGVDEMLTWRPGQMGANEWIERRSLSMMFPFAAWSAVWEPKRRVRFPGNPRRMPNYLGQKPRRHRPFVRRANSPLKRPKSHYLYSQGVLFRVYIQVTLLYR